MWLLAIKSPVKVIVCCATTVLAKVADALNVAAALTVTLSDAPSPRVVSPLIWIVSTVNVPLNEALLRVLLFNVCVAAKVTMVSAVATAPLEGKT